MGGRNILSMPPGISSDNFIGAGTSGICFRYPGTNKVIKIPLTAEEESRACQVEMEVYERIQNLPTRPSSILTYYGNTKYRIELAYASHGSIRQYRASGGQFLQEQPLVYYNSSHRRPDNSEGPLVTTVQTEIFAFGSFLYELVTGIKPPTSDEGLDSFPDVTNVLLGAVMLGCWNGEFGSMNDVRQKIREETRSLETLGQSAHDVLEPIKSLFTSSCPIKGSPLTSLFHP
ncbi:MAG: hypothetical protein M1834_001466 [Cirrosporium novae-zelandiae]|nr:MAG: hypothetical protein M1834_001466 [Cirrosporium novae-zelandiae]